MRAAIGRGAMLLTVSLAIASVLPACDSGKSGKPKASDSRPPDSDPVRARATEAVLDQIVKPDTLDHDVVVRATAEPLPAGTEVRSFATSEFGTQVTFETREPTLLYLVDDSPYSLFGHPVRYVFVAAETAKVVKAVEHDFWPLVDGAYPFADAPDDAIVFARVRSKSAAGRASNVTSAPLSLESAVSRNELSSEPACPPGHVRTCYSIVVSGGGAVLGSNTEEDHADWVKALQNPGGGCRAVIEEVSGVTDPKGASTALWTALDKVAGLAECCDRVTLVISAHGMRYKKDANGKWIEWRQGNAVMPGDRLTWGVILGDDVVGVVPLEEHLDGIRSCHISVVDGSCYSGGFVEALKGFDTVEAVISSTGSDETRETYESDRGTTYLQTLLMAYQAAQAAAPSEFPDEVLERSVAPASAADPFVAGVDSESGAKLTDHPKVHVRAQDAVCPCCGDGMTQSSEECDDGNRANGDGCSADCAVESDGGMPPGDAGRPDAAAPDAGAPTDAGNGADAGTPGCVGEGQLCDITPDGSGAFLGNCCAGMKCFAGCYGGCTPGTCCDPYAQGTCVVACAPADCSLTSCYGCY